jgi:hypothetical protein
MTSVTYTASECQAYSKRHYRRAGGAIVSYESYAESQTAENALIRLTPARNRPIALRPTRTFRQSLLFLVIAKEIDLSFWLSKGMILLLASC